MQLFLKRVIPVLLLAFAALPVYAQTPSASSASVPTATAKPGPFDPKRDAADDLTQAIVAARRTNRNILVDVGGNWCSWCREMDRFVEENTELRQLRDRNFVLVKVNYSPENENRAVLSAYPQIKGYPHLFVLDLHGKLLHSQDTSELEQGKSYDLQKYKAFLNKWAPKK